jgi:hypothetical protein
VYERGFVLGGVAKPTSQPGVSGGGAALQPAFAGYGHKEVPPSINSPKHIANGMPIIGNGVPAIVRAKDAGPVQALTDCGPLSDQENSSSEPVIREE